MRLKVTNKWHTHRGKTYYPGEEFDGSERLLKVNPDRLEAAPKPARAKKVKTVEVDRDADAASSK